MFAILNKSHRKTKPNMCETLRQYSDFYSPSVALSLEATHSYRGHECILSFFFKNALFTAEGRFMWRGLEIQCDRETCQLVQTMWLIDVFCITVGSPAPSFCLWLCVMCFSCTTMVHTGLSCTRLDKYLLKGSINLWAFCGIC